jgi:DNA helicase II / ATP-dependent DNA helicase PcrA
MAELSLEQLTAGLNDAQKQAVLTLEGPLLIVAGPGSGKTRVLTHRVGALLATGVAPWRILAVTFTNKAASEMQERLTTLVGEQGKGLWISTFHKLCGKLLRMYGERIGIDPNFTILDQDDSLKMVKEAVAANGGLPEEARRMQGLISFAKNNLTEPQDMPDAPSKIEYYAREYERRKRAAGVIDFDDMLVLVFQLCQEPDVLSELRTRFSYVMVDEYQDTNRVQYEIVKALTSLSRNLCVVGDSDQCLLATTPIHTPTGVTPISEVGEGSEVTATSGSMAPRASLVREAVQRQYLGTVVTVKAGSHELTGTPLHLVPARVVSAARLTALAEESQGVVSLTMFAGKEGQKLRHSVLLISPTSEGLDMVREAGFLVEPPRVGTLGFRVELFYADYRDALQAANRLGKVAGAAVERRMKIGEHSYLLMPIGSLHHGMQVLTLDGDEFREVEVDEVVRSEYSGLVYDLEVTDTHNYVAGGIVVHNSVYSWRGAYPGVLSGFIKDYPEAETIRLGQNYRSTKKVLAVAGAIISVNPSLARADLWTENVEGEPVRIMALADDREEAAWVAADMRGRAGTTAVIVRTNAQTKPFEDVLMSSRVPFQLVGAQRFFDRAEVKDAMSWLRAGLNHRDRIALVRAAGAPKRGLGDKTLSAWFEAAAARGVDPIELTHDEYAMVDLGSRGAGAVLGFARAIESVSEAAEVGPEAAIKQVVRVGLLEGMERERAENVNQLLSSAADFDGGGLGGLEVTRDFVESVALTGSADAGREDAGAPPAYLITAHAAKGREFDNVYVVGVEEGIYPHVRSEGDEEMAEERRLLFVAASRARHLLTLSWCARRNRFGHYEDSEPSPFLEGLSEHTVEIAVGHTRRDEWRSQPTAQSIRNTVGSARITAVASQRAVPSKVDTSQYGPGTTVEHATFGRGTIKSLSGDNAVIKFTDKTRTLALGFARLTVVLTEGE